MQLLLTIIGTLLGIGAFLTLGILIGMSYMAWKYDIKEFWGIDSNVDSTGNHYVNRTDI